MACENRKSTKSTPAYRENRLPLPFILPFHVFAPLLFHLYFTFYRSCFPRHSAFRFSSFFLSFFLSFSLSLSLFPPLSHSFTILRSMMLRSSFYPFPPPLPRLSFLFSAVLVTAYIFRSKFLLPFSPMSFLFYVLLFSGSRDSGRSYRNSRVWTAKQNSKS